MARPCSGRKFWTLIMQHVLLFMMLLIIWAVACLYGG